MHLKGSSMEAVFKNYDESNLRSFLLVLKEACSLKELNRYFKLFCENNGMPEFAIAEIFKNENNNSKIEIFSTYPEEWQKIYIEKNYYLYDPVYNAVQSSNFPFFWTKDSFISNNLKQKQLFIDAERFGIVSGMTIPLLSKYSNVSFFTVLGTVLKERFDLVSVISIASRAYFSKKENIKSSIP